jgi:alcohol dehydrogenase
MKALVYRGPGKKSFDDVAKPALREANDCIVRVTKTTICGTDLHILKGDVATVGEGRVLGHEGVGIVEEAGVGVSAISQRRSSPDLLHHRLREM